MHKVSVGMLLFVMFSCSLCALWGQAVVGSFYLEGGMRGGSGVENCSEVHIAASSAGGTTTWARPQPDKCTGSVHAVDYDNAGAVCEVCGGPSRG